MLLPSRRVVRMLRYSSHNNLIWRSESLAFMRPTLNDITSSCESLNRRPVAGVRQLAPVH